MTAIKFRVLLANPRGFCAGVDRAIEIVNRALKQFGAPVYVRHEVVHNKTVVQQLAAKGAIFVDEIEEIPEGSLCIFSAHGVAQQVRRDAEERGLKVFDATCPLVTKVHIEISKAADLERETILIGHAGHPEVEGTLGQYEPSTGGGGTFLVEDLEQAASVEVQDPRRLSYVTQTTLSVDDTKTIIARLKQRFPEISGPRKDDICYATQNRQDAVKLLAKDCQIVLVVGSENSSNSNRLRELAERLGAKAYLIEDASKIQPEWLAGGLTVGVTSGASAPESLVDGVLAFLKNSGGVFEESQAAAVESMEFSLPRELR
jgi:4-hydroxy-3-methylbut-2-enyl diphosphate reductase